MSAETLWMAAAAEREEWGDPETRRVFPKASAIHLALADWLEFVEQRHGPCFVDRDETPSCNFVGCYENEEYPCPDLLAAETVARLILGGAS